MAHHLDKQSICLSSISSVNWGLVTQCPGGQKSVVKKITKRRYQEARPRAHGFSHLHAAPGPALWNADVYALLPELPSKWQFLESHWRALQAVCYLCGVLWIWFLPEMTSWQTCFPNWQYFTRKWFEIKGQEVEKFSNVLHRPETPTVAWAHGQGGRMISMNQGRSLVGSKQRIF